MPTFPFYVNDLNWKKKEEEKKTFALLSRVKREMVDF